MKYSDVKITRQVINMKEAKGVYFTVTNMVYSPGKFMVKYAIPAKQYHDFMLYVATCYVAAISNAIDSQRYLRNWKPLNIHYLTYKRKHHLSLKIWEATGHMKESMRVFKRGDYIAVGFDNRAIYPKSLIRVNLVARFLEFGSRDNSHPPSRPLWRPLHMYFRKNIWRFYKAYKKELKLRHKKYLFVV